LKTARIGCVPRIGVVYKLLDIIPAIWHSDQLIIGMTHPICTWLTKNPAREKGLNEAYSDRKRRKFENHGNQFRLHLLFESLSLELALFPRKHVISYSIDGNENSKNKIKYTKDK